MNNSDLDHTIEHVIAAARRAGEGELLLKIMGALHSIETIEQVWALLGRLVEERKREPRPYVRKAAITTIKKEASETGEIKTKPKAASDEKPEPERPDLELTPPSPLDLTLRAIDQAQSVEDLLEVAAAAGQLQEADKIVARAAYQRKQDDLDRPNR
jgi:uncharacterized protein with PhoU and TrkA domain